MDSTADGGYVILEHDRVSGLTVANDYIYDALADAEQDADGMRRDEANSQRPQAYGVAKLVVEVEPA